MRSRLLRRPDIAKANIRLSFEKSLTGTDVFFSLVWNKNRPVALVQLVSTLNDETKETDHLHDPIKDTDGEISVRLGTYKKDDILSIQFSVLAFAKIDAAGVYMNQSNPVASKKSLPAGDNKFKSIEMGKLWDGNFKYKVIGDVA